MRSMVEGWESEPGVCGGDPSTTRFASGPPPRSGEVFFADAARRLSGIAGVMFGWAPDVFWRATPAELGALVAVLAGDDGGVPPDAAMVARLREAFPDG